MTSALKSAKKAFLDGDFGTCVDCCQAAIRDDPKVYASIHLRNITTFNELCGTIVHKFMTLGAVSVPS